MYKINIFKHKITDKKPHVYQKDSNEIQNFTLSSNLKPKYLNFHCETVKTGREIMIKINLYMHSLTLDEKQHLTMRNVARKLFMYASSAYF